MREWIPITTMYDSIPSFPTKAYPVIDIQLFCLILSHHVFISAPVAMCHRSRELEADPSVQHLTLTDYIFQCSSFLQPKDNSTNTYTPDFSNMKKVTPFKNGKFLGIYVRFLPCISTMLVTSCFLWHRIHLSDRGQASCRAISRHGKHKGPETPPMPRFCQKLPKKTKSYVGNIGIYWIYP